MESLPLFLIASIALIITPGPDIIYVLTRGISDGKRAGLLSAIGVTLGILFHTIAASLGLALLLKTSIYAYWALKIIGGCYLIYLGIQILKNKKAFALTIRQQRFNNKKCLIQGLLTNISNPKVALFFIAFLPQFVNMERQHHNIYMIFLGLTFALMTFICLTTLGLFAGSIGDWLQKRKRIAGKIRLGSGITLLLLGVRLLVPQKQ